MKGVAVPDELLARIRRFHDHTLSGVQEQFQTLVTHGHPQRRRPLRATPR